MFLPIQFGHEKEIRDQIAMSCYLNSYHNCKNVLRCFIEEKKVSPSVCFLNFQIASFVLCTLEF